MIYAWLYWAPLSKTTSTKAANYCAFFLGQQVKKLMQSIRQYEVPLHKYVAMMELEVTLPHMYP